MSDTIHVDRALARRILGGDEAAFRGLFDSFFPRLYRFALARLDGDHEAAREVVQQTFCKAVERLETYRGEAALYTWFCQVCRNTLIDHQRAMHRETRTVVLLEDQPNVRAILESFVAPADEQPDLRAWQQDVRRLVQATVDTLPDHYSEILELKYVDGLSLQDIAEQLNVGTKAAESLLMRARTAFREAILAVAETPDALQPLGGDSGR
ncbi:MAG TPA: sigma-70 family RNA polymerase sigma factor [Steroidobacteraceae bacterium]|nr:sigma-70 family RNA polymerase sigma factor [Steroidobacteraceae bacterium]